VTLKLTETSLVRSQPSVPYGANYPRESEGICFTGVGLSVCLSVTTITKTIVDGFVPNFMGRFLGEREDQVRVSLRSVEECRKNSTIAFAGICTLSEYFPSNFYLRL